MIEVKPLKAEDILFVIENGVKEVGLKAIPTDEMNALAKEREESGMCFTGWVNGEVIGVAGIDRLWEGCGNVWMMLTPLINKHVKESYICIRKGMEKLIKENKLRRIQSYGRVDFPACHILFDHLNFEVEGIARKYSPDGVDCILYSLITE